jgi:hypothetical protein
MDTNKFYKALNGEDGDSIFKTHLIGEIVLTSGKLVACDPLACPDSDAFQQFIPIGKYPTFLIVEHYPRNNDQRVAYGMIRITEQIPVKWELGISSDEELNLLLSEDEIVGYPVDSGVGCFMDEDAVQIIDDSIHYAYVTKTDSLTDKLQEELSKNYSPTWKWANMCIDESTNLNIIAFSSGIGDGIYPTYFGYNAEGKIVSVVTEF